MATLSPEPPAAPWPTLTNMMVQQANVLAYIDTIHALVILTVCLIPIGYLMKKPRYRSKQTAPVE